MNTDITCKRAVDLISKREEGRLTSVQRFQLWKHLAVCSLCQRFLQQSKLLQKVSEFKADQQLKEEYKQDIIEAVLGQGRTNL